MVQRSLGFKSRHWHREGENHGKNVSDLNLVVPSGMVVENSAHDLRLRVQILPLAHEERK
jgi:hypothetical protein